MPRLSITDDEVITMLPLEQWDAVQPSLAFYARYYARLHVLEREDLSQIGAVAVCQAWERYDQAQASWPTFAKQVIRWAMIDAIRAIWGRGKVHPAFLDADSVAVQRLHDLMVLPMEQSNARLSVAFLLKTCTQYEAEVIVAHDITGEYLHELATHYGNTESAVCAARQRALKHMQQHVEDAPPHA